MTLPRGPTLRAVSESEYNPSSHPPFAVTADVIVFTVVEGVLHVALVERGNDPYRGKLALPGGFVEPDEDLPDAAARELEEETGIESGTAGLTQLGAYGAPGRDPRMRVVTVAFWTIQPGVSQLTGGSDAASARLVPVDEALADPGVLAFDHHQILSDAVERARSAIGSSK